MERYITDEIFNHMNYVSSVELILAEKKLSEKLGVYIPECDYLNVEEELHHVYSILEREFFYYGFKEGIRFLLDLF